MSEYACDLEMAQNSNRLVSLLSLLEILITCQNSFQAYFFSSKILRWLKIRRESEVLNAWNFEPSQDHMHIPTCDIGCLDGFLSYLRVPPVYTTRRYIGTLTDENCSFGH